MRCATLALFHAPVRAVRNSGAQSHAGTAVQNGSDADVNSYLNMTRLPVIGTE